MCLSLGLCKFRLLMGAVFQERSKTYILKENLDQAIEYALANPVDYNYAIDLQENIFTGRTSKKPNSIDAETQSQTATVSA